MKIRRINSRDETIRPQPSLDYLISIATHIDLSFDAYSLNRLSPNEMRWDFNKQGHLFRLRLD